MESVNENLESVKKSSARQPFLSSTRNKVLVAAGVVVLLFAVLWIWKSIQISNLKKENEKRETALKQQAEEEIQRADMRYLKLLAKPYVWAIRTEMMKGNIEAVNLYANDIVKEKNFQAITVVDDKGIVISSTDKKLEGKQYSSIGNAAYLTTDSTIAEKNNGNNIVVSSPVMGFNKRIGTLILSYNPRIPNFL